METLSFQRGTDPVNGSKNSSCKQPIHDKISAHRLQLKHSRLNPCVEITNVSQWKGGQGRLSARRVRRRRICWFVPGRRSSPREISQRDIGRFV